MLILYNKLTGDRLFRVFRVLLPILDIRRQVRSEAERCSGAERLSQRTRLPVGAPAAGHQSTAGSQRPEDGADDRLL